MTKILYDPMIGFILLNTPRKFSTIPGFLVLIFKLKLIDRAIKQQGSEDLVTTTVVNLPDQRRSNKSLS